MFGGGGATGKGVKERTDRIVARSLGAGGLRCAADDQQGRGEEDGGLGELHRDGC